MVGEGATGLVGVITIDEADFEPATVASLGCDRHDDATLAQVLARLATRITVSGQESLPRAIATGNPRWQRGHFAGRLAPFWATSASVSANLGGLAAELEQALAQVLRRIVASR